MAFLGVSIIKGFGIDVNTIGLLLVITSALFLGLIFVVIRKLSTKEHPLVIINYFMVMAFVFGGLMSINNWTQPNLTAWMLLLSLGVFGYVGQLYMTKPFNLIKRALLLP